MVTAMRIIPPLFVLMAAALPALPQQPAANLSIYTGECRVWHQGKTDEAEVGQPLFTGDSVMTGKDSKAEVSFMDGTSVRISERTRLVVAQADTLRSLKLLWGKLWAKVAKLSSAQCRFQVETPTAVAGVRGTVFRVEVDPDAATRVAVEEGEVEVSEPRLSPRMVRLAARRQSFFRRGRDPSQPEDFDLAKEPRWERWSGKAFAKLSKSVGGILDAMERRLKQLESLHKSAVRLRERRDAGKLDAGETSSLRRRFADDQRQWRTLLLRSERRLQQLLILARRVEVDGETSALGEQADAARARLDALVQRRQELEVRISEELESLEQEGRIDGTGDGASLLDRMSRLAAAARSAQGRLDALEPRLEAVIGRLADFARELAEVRQLYPEHPLIARERFFKLRNDYFAFKLQNHGFEYKEFDRDAAAQRKASFESTLMSRKIQKGDPGYGDCTTKRDEIDAVSQKYTGVMPKVRQIKLASRAIDRQLLEFAGLIR
jgi:hypothetical protein